MESTKSSSAKKSSMEQMMDYANEFRTLLNESFRKNYQSMREQATRTMTLREYALQMQKTMMEMREQFNQGYEVILKTARKASSRSSSFDWTPDQVKNPVGTLDMLSEDLLYQVMSFLPPASLAIFSSQVNQQLTFRCTMGAKLLWRQHIYTRWQLAPDDPDFQIDLSTMTNDELRRLYPLCAMMVRYLIDDSCDELQFLSKTSAQFLGTPGESNRSLQTSQPFPTLVIKQDISMMMVNACANMMLKMMLAMRNNKITDNSNMELTFPSPTTLMREMLYSCVPHYSSPFAVVDTLSGHIRYNITPRCVGKLKNEMFFTLIF